MSRRPDGERGRQLCVQCPRGTRFSLRGFFSGQGLCRWHWVVDRWGELWARKCGLTPPVRV